MPSAEALLLSGTQKGNASNQRSPAGAWDISAFSVPTSSASAHFSLLNIGIPAKIALTQDEQHSVKANRHKLWRQTDLGVQMSTSGQDCWPC